MRQHPAGRPGFRGPRRAIASVATLLVATTAAPRVASQSIDISPAHLRAGQALALSVRVRAEDAGAAPLPPRCIEAEWIADGRLWPSGETRVRTRADVDEGWTLVDLRHPYRLQGSQADVRLTLRCGPVYERHFSVSTGPGRPHADATGLTHASTTRHKIKRVAATTSTAEITRPTGVATTSPDDSRQGVATSATAYQADAATSPQLPSVHPAGMSSMPPASIRPPLPATTSDQPLLPPRQEPPPTANLPSTSPTDEARMRQTLERLQADHQKALSQLGVVRARLVHAERSPSATTWALLGGLLLMALAQLGRAGADRPLHAVHARSHHTGLAGWSALARRATWPGRRQGQATSDLDAVTTGNASAAIASSPSNKPMPAGTPATAPLNTAPAPGVLATPEANTWRHGDFGKPSLDSTGVEDLLGEVERLAIDGFPAAAAMTVENTLMQQPGKHPALLLALLDLYEDMGQTWNRERVAAQLEALYNVTLTGDAASHQPNASEPLAGLEHCTASLDRICRTWRGPEATKAIDNLLRRPAVLEVLPLAAFRDTVWLHRMASLQQELHDDDTLELSLAPLHLH